MKKLGLTMREKDRLLVRSLSPMASRMPKTEQQRQEQYEQEREMMLQEAMKKHGMSREEVLKIKGQLL